MEGGGDIIAATSELFTKCAAMMKMLELNKDTQMMLGVCRDKEAADLSPLDV